MKQRLTRLFSVLLTVLVLGALLAVGTAASAPVTTELSAVSAVISDGVDIRIAGTVAAADRAKRVTVAYTFYGVSTEVAVAPDANGAFSLTVPVGPGQMYGEIAVQLYVDGEAVYGEPKTTSVKAYCAALLADAGTSPALRRVLSDVLTYGAAALEYVGDTAGAARLLDGVTLTTTAYVAPTVTVSSYEGSVFRQARVILNNRLNLAAEDALGNRTSVERIRFLDAWRPYEIADSNGDVLTYSVAAYVAAMDEDASAGATVRALYSLCLSLDAYVGHAYVTERVDGSTHRVVCTRCADVSASGVAHTYETKDARPQGAGACAETHVYGVCVCGAERLERRIAACKEHTYVAQDSGLNASKGGSLIFTCTGCGASYSVPVLRAATFTGSTVSPFLLDWQSASYRATYADGRLQLIGPMNSDSFSNNVFLQLQYTGTMTDTKHMVVGFDVTMPAAGMTEATFGAQIKIGGTWTTGQMVHVDADGGIWLGDRLEQIGRLTAGVMTRVMLDMRLDAAGTTLTYTVYLDGQSLGTATKAVSGTPDFSNGGTYVQLNIPVNAYGTKEAEATRGVILDNVYLANEITLPAASGGSVPLETTEHSFVYRATGATHARYCTVCGTVDLASVSVHAYDTVARQHALGTGACASLQVYRGCSACGAEDGTPVLVAAEGATHEYEFKSSLSTLTSTSSHNGGHHTAPYGTLVYQCKHCDARYTVDVVSDRTFDTSCPCGTILWPSASGSTATLSYRNGRLHMLGALNKTNFTNNIYLQMQYLSGTGVPSLTNVKHMVIGYDIGMPAAGIPESGFETNIKVGGSWTSGAMLLIKGSGEIWIGGTVERIGALSSTRMTNVVIDMLIDGAGTTMTYDVYIDGVYAGTDTKAISGTPDFSNSGTYLQLNVPVNGKGDQNVDTNRGIILDNCFLGNELPAFDPSPEELHAKHVYDSEGAEVTNDTITLVCTVCAMSKTIPAVAVYDDFGAVGDGVTDDSAAIRAAHEFANKWGVPVAATQGKTYRIGVLDSSIPVKTDVDWKGATIYIDDSEILYTDKTHREVNVFAICGQPYTRLSVPAAMTLTKGQTNIGMTFDRACMLKIVNANERIFIRNGTSGNQNAGEEKHEYILVDKNGNVDPSTPIQYDYSAVTTIYRYEIDDAPITVKNGTLITNVPDPKAQDPNYENQYVYYARGIKVTRSNATLSNLVHRIVGEQMVGVDRDGDGQVTTGSSSASVYNSDKPYGVPYSGFFSFECVYNATFRDSTVQDHQAFNFFTESGVRNEMGSYDLSGRGCIGWNLLNLTQYENEATGETITNRTMYHGVMGSNFCRNIVMDGCYLDRFDSHQGLHNATIKNSTLGFGILVIGGGHLQIENVTRTSGTEFILLREDYNSQFDGSITIKNCTAGANVTALIKGSWYEHNIGLPNCVGTTITVDGLKTSQSTFYVYKLTNATADSLTNATNPLSTPTSVSVSNLSGSASKLILCPYAQRKAFSSTSLTGSVKTPSIWQ